MAEKSVTRGYGLLEKQLAKQRAKVANRLIPTRLRAGRLLDIGCGVHPFFLLHTDFQTKFGLDHAVKQIESTESINLLSYDLRKERVLPFEDDYFDVVTMLAVFEHIEPEILAGVLDEIRRVLKPGGLYILTTPAGWTDRLLRIFAKLRLVSSVEIDDHKDAYNHAKIVSLLLNAKFKEANITCGYFELFVNLWVSAGKEEPPL